MKKKVSQKVHASQKSRGGLNPHWGVELLQPKSRKAASKSIDSSNNRKISLENKNVMIYWNLSNFSIPELFIV